MTFGEKLKFLRRQRNLTQSELAGKEISRNMLSQIERGAALPSYSTLSYLCGVLKIDPSYFFDGGEDFLFYELNSSMPQIRSLYKAGLYEKCLEICAPFEGLSSRDDFSFIVCDCYYQLGVLAFKNSDFSSADDCFSHCMKRCSDLLLPSDFSKKITFFRTVMQSLSTHSGFITGVSGFMADRDEYFDFKIYCFLDSLIDQDQTERAVVLYNVIGIKNELYRCHFNARIAASLNNYDRAKELLLSIVSCEDAPKPFLYKVYNDLERYCKATDDYKGAYECVVQKERCKPDHAF